MDRAQLADLFEGRVRRLTTADFLSDPDLVALIAPMMRDHLDEEIMSLRERLECHACVDAAAAFVAARPRIALTNWTMKQAGGSELWTADMARYLARLGFPLFVYSPVLGEVSDELHAEGIDVADDPGAVARFAPEIMVVNHFAHSAPALAAIGPDAVVVNTIHGLLPGAEAPGLSGVDAHLAVALHAKAKTQLLTGIDWRRIVLTPNFFDPLRFRPQSGSGRPRRALLFSSKTTPAQRERLGAILAQTGYGLDHTGFNGGTPSGTPQELLSGYDLVFAVARSAIEALACGCRVILCDAGLIGPLVTEDNAWTCVASNFSLLGCVLPWKALDEPEAEAWVLDQACREDRSAIDFARAYLSLDIVGPLHLAEYGRAMARRAA